VKPANLSKRNALSKTGGHWVENFCLQETVSWLRIVDLSLQKVGFDPRPAREMRGRQSEQGQEFLRVLCYSPVSIISPVLNNHHHLQNYS
jgi:hypothetical protein